MRQYGNITYIYCKPPSHLQLSNIAILSLQWF